MTLTEHLLTILAEECVEVAQRCTKALRFGLFEVQPGQPLMNTARIYQEYADVLAAMEMLLEHCPALGEGLPSLGAMVDAKRLRICKYLDYSTQQGTLGTL